MNGKSNENETEEERACAIWKKQVEIFSSSIVCRAIKITFFFCFFIKGWINSSTLSPKDRSPCPLKMKMKISTLATCSLSSYCGNKLRNTHRKERKMLKSFVGSVCNHFDICCEKKVYWNWVSRKRSMILSISFTISRFFFFSLPYYTTQQSCALVGSLSLSVRSYNHDDLHTYIQRASCREQNQSKYYISFYTISFSFSPLLFHSLRRSNVHLVLISYPYRMACWEFCLLRALHERRRQRE